MDTSITSSAQNALDTPVTLSPDDSTDPQPRAYFRLLVACVFAVVILVASVALLVPLPSGGRAQPAVGDMVHCPLFAGLTLFSFACWRCVSPLGTLGQSMRRATICAVVFFLIGIAIEFAQSISGRSATVHDVLSNGMGTAAAWMLILAWSLGRWRGTSLPARAAISCLIVLPVALSWQRSIGTLADIRAMSSEFPLLGSFERHAELDRWNFARCVGRREKTAASDGHFCLAVHYPSSLLGLHSAATLYEMQSDWTGMKSVAVDATLDANHPEASIEVAIQVIDHRHGRHFHDIFHRRFEIKPGITRTLQIPCDELISRNGRPLDRDEIRYLDLQLVRADWAATVRFDAIRLIPASTGD